MDKIVGIDYGRKKFGIAMATSPIAEPYSVIRYESIEEALRKIESIIKKEKVDKIVVGISEGKMAEETMKFAEELRKSLDTPIFFQDETLTTQKAQELSIQAGVKRKKRRELEDAYSACLILQDYLDSKEVK